MSGTSRSRTSDFIQAVDRLPNDDPGRPSRAHPLSTTPAFHSLIPPGVHCLHQAAHCNYPLRPPVLPGLYRTQPQGLPCAFLQVLAWWGCEWCVVWTWCTSHDWFTGESHVSMMGLFPPVISFPPRILFSSSPALSALPTLPGPLTPCSP